MKVIAGWTGLGCLLLFGCSHPMLMVERPIADGYLKVVELSNDGQVRETGQSQVKLPHPVAVTSDMALILFHPSGVIKLRVLSEGLSQPTTHTLSVA